MKRALELRNEGETKGRVGTWAVRSSRSAGRKCKPDTGLPIQPFVMSVSDYPPPGHAEAGRNEIKWHTMR